jgi:hypothetical protein
MLLLGNIGQQLDIQDTEQALGEIADQLRATGQFDQEVAKRLDRLEAENAELKLYLAAVVRLMVTKGTIAPAELHDIVNAIDQSDGRADGQYSGPIPPA